MAKEAPGRFYHRLYAPRVKKIPNGIHPLEGQEVCGLVKVNRTGI
jgi:hypothetical protein